MNERATELAKRLVEHERWEWMGGMLVSAQDGMPAFRVLGLSERTARAVTYGQLECYAYGCECQSVHVPDLDDPATVGCLRYMLMKEYVIGLRALETMMLSGDGEYWADLLLRWWGGERPLMV